MKTPNWLKKIWQSIKSLFNNIPADMKLAIHTGVIVTENIKNFVESPVADVLTVLIPGEMDDRVKDMLRLALPKLLIQLKLTEDCCDAKTPAEITHCAVLTAQSLTGNIRNTTLHNISLLIAQIAADGKLSWQDGAYIMEWYYQNYFKNKS